MHKNTFDVKRPLLAGELLRYDRPKGHKLDDRLRASRQWEDLMHGLNEGYRTITVTRCSPTIGAEIGNIDLTRPLADLELAELKRAFTENLVIFFRNQKISFEDHVRLAEYFGPTGSHFGKK